ncbi:MAG: hypothetical protein QOJ76_907 [Acidobacteriota bacterium]|jgi:hypothetical protein|nr:hypothetical protein [Acidobacteriota bacterium]
MQIVWGLVFIVMIVMVFLHWVLKLGRFGFMMIGMTVCVPVMMACVLNLHGSQRYWAVVPTVAFFALVALFYRDWSG